MSFISKPFGVLLLWLYEFTKNYGLAVILFAVIVKLILLPFMMKSKRGMMRMNRLQPMVQEIQKRHSGNPQKMNEEIQKLYQNEKVNPMSGCIWSLIPFPILIALYYAIRCPLTTMMGVPSELIAEGGAIYNKLVSLGFDFTAHNSSYIEIAEAQFISKNWSVFEGLSDKLRQIDFTFLGLDLGKVPNWKFFTSVDWNVTSQWLPELGLFMIPVLAAVLGWVATKISTKMNATGAEQNAQQKQQTVIMNVMMNGMTLWFCFIMPAALGVYWAINSVLGIIQDVILTVHYNKKLDKENAEETEQRRRREAELEAKRLETERLRELNATEQNPNTSKRKMQQRERQEQTEKAAEWERRHSADTQETDPARVGNRPYARGRAYDPHRYEKVGVGHSAVSEDAAEDNTDVSGEAESPRENGQDN